MLALNKKKEQEDIWPPTNEKELNVQKEDFSLTLKTSLQWGDLLTCTIYYVMLEERKKLE